MKIDKYGNVILDESVKDTPRKNGHTPHNRSSKRIWLLILAVVCAVFIISRMNSIERESKPESFTGSAQNEQVDQHTNNHQMTESGKIYTVFGPGNVFLMTEDSEYTNKPVSVSKGQAKELQFVPHHSGYYKYYSYGDWGDTFGYIKLKDGTIVAQDDDSGDAINFSMEYYFEKGNEYILGVRFTDASKSGNVFLHMRRK